MDMRVLLTALAICALSFVVGVAGDLSSGMAPPAEAAPARVEIPPVVEAAPEAVAALAAPRRAPARIVRLAALSAEIAPIEAPPEALLGEAKAAPAVAGKPRPHDAAKPDAGKPAR